MSPPRSLHQVPAELHMVDISHDIRQPALEPGLKSHIVLQHQHLPEPSFHHLRVISESEVNKHKEQKTSRSKEEGSNYAVRPQRTWLNGEMMSILKLLSVMRKQNTAFYVAYFLSPASCGRYPIATLHLN